MAYKFQLGAARLSGSTTFEQALVGESSISASAALQGASLAADGDAVLGGSLTAVGIAAGGAISGATTIDASGDLTVGSITNAEFTVDSSGNTDIDGTLNVEGVPTFQAAAVFSNGITTAGAIAGATTVDASGLASLDGGIDVNGSNFTVATDGDVSAAAISGSGVLSAASLSLDSVAVTATAAELNYLDNDDLSAARIAYVAGVTAGTAIASKAVVLDASKDVTGINNLTASYFAGNGSGITNINVSNLDAVGSDTYVQFNQNGEFGAAAGFTFDGTGSVSTSVKVSSVALSASAAVSAASFAADGAAVLGGSLTATDIFAGGAVSGVTTLAASGLASVASISMDDGSTLGPDSVADLVTFSADGDITIKDGAYDFNIAAHDGTNGLALAGTIVGAAANDLNLAQGMASSTGTAVASAFVALDAAKDITGINNLTASYFSGNGSGITNIDVSNLDATGQDGYIQFNQNSEFGANAGLVYNGTGSVVISGSTSGFQNSTLGFGTGASQLGQIGVSDDDGYIFLVAAQGGLDLSGSDGVSALIPPGGGFGVVGTGNHSLKIGDMDENYNVELSSQGVISGSGNITNLGAIISDGVVTSNAGLKADAGSYGLFANDLTRSAGDLNIKLHDASANQVNFRLAGGSMPLSVLSTGIVQMDSTRIAIGTNAGEISGSGGLKMGGAVQLDGADASVAFVVADSMYFRDADTGQMRRDSWTDVVSATAGAGITATNGVLSTDAQSVSTAFNASVALEEGYNIYTGSANVNVALPTGSNLSAGDIFVVKQGAAGDVTVTCAGTDLIDGSATVLLESPYAAVSLVFSGVDGQFRIV